MAANQSICYANIMDEGYSVSMLSTFRLNNGFIGNYQQIFYQLFRHVAGNNVKMENERVMMDLHTACNLGDEEYVKQLLEIRVVDVNAKNYDGWTPLMYAAWSGHDALVLQLVNAGACRQQLNDQGQTALHLAAKSGCVQTVQLVFQKSILDLTDIGGKTALFYSVQFGFLDNASYLLLEGANANLSCEGTTPLMVAAANGHSYLVEQLLTHGADREARDKQGLTAQQLAVKEGHLHLVPLLDLPAHGCDDLKRFLESLSLEKYWIVFQNHGINLGKFLYLSEEDLKAIGIKLLGPRRKMSLAIAAFKANNTKH